MPIVPKRVSAMARPTYNDANLGRIVTLKSKPGKKFGP